MANLLDPQSPPPPIHQPTSNIIQYSCASEREIIHELSVLPGESAAEDMSSPESNAERKHPPMSDRIIRGNIIRLQRNLQTPYLLRQPQVYGLPCVLLVVCFYAEAYHLPWVMFFAVVANGMLAHLV